MNEEKLNLSVRKFLKNVGITSQRKIEEKVREKIKSSNISNSKKIIISAQLFSEELNLNEKIEGEIEIEI
jgi:fructose-bisphosphate aldolase class 1|tara:strand:+ start:342 stop:551 length:210 start_codon:yes stop_codon:yes gene_type:complete